MGRFVVVLMAFMAVGHLPTRSPSVRAVAMRDPVAATIPAVPDPVDRSSVERERIETAVPEPERSKP